MMDTPSWRSVAEFSALVRTARAAYDEAAGRLSEAEWLQVGAAGTWSPKDVLAHIVWHEREMVGLLQTRALVGSELWNLALEERNQAIYEANKGRGLAEVQAEGREVFEALLAELERLEEADLYEAGRFKGMPEDWQPWEVIASNTYEHYEDHVADLRAFFDSRL